MTTIENHYFKDAGQRPWTPLMSGLPLPISEDGKVHDHKFVRCDFHPVCDNVVFVGCEFVGCNGDEWLKKQ